MLTTRFYPISWLLLLRIFFFLLFLFVFPVNIFTGQLVQAMGFLPSTEGMLSSSFALRSFRDSA
jgi:hypothetical protein